MSDTTRPLDAPTQSLPRVPRRAGADATRLALDALADVAEPTVVTTRPAGGYRPGGPVRAPYDPVPAFARIAQAAEAAPRVRWRGPRWARGIFGWRPATPPTLREVAEARTRTAEREARRQHRHARHMDVLETVRAYLGVVSLVVAFLVLGMAAWLAWGILAGWYVWAPTRVH